MTQGSLQQPERGRSLSYPIIPTPVAVADDGSGKGSARRVSAVDELEARTLKAERVCLETSILQAAYLPHPIKLQL